MGIKSSLKPASNAGGVDLHIDTAYDNIKKVADNLPDILALWATIDALNGVYLGTYTSNPTTRPDTSPLQNGDHYLNTSNNLLYVYLDGGWIFHAIFYTQDALNDAVATSPFYTWYAYADDATGTNISLTPDDREYVGIAANQNTTTVSIADPNVFTWYKMSGIDGLTSHLHIAYADSADGTVNFNFTNGDYIGQYTDFAVADSNDPTDYTWRKWVGDAGITPTKGVDYFDGADGRFTSFIYLNAENAPVTPVGGSFDGTNETVPPGWADDPTIPSSDNIKTWISKGVYVYNKITESWDVPTWSLPSIAYQKGDKPVYGTDYVTADGAFVSLIFRNAVSQPSTPIGGSYDGTNETFPTDWLDDPVVAVGSEITWVSRRTYVHDGISWSATDWSAPVMFFKEGQDGVTPAKGIDYFDGLEGAFVSFVFRNGPGVTQMSTPTGGNFDGTTETPPTGWTDNPVNPTGSDVTWVSKGIWRTNGTIWITPTWGTPTIFRERASDGVNGVDGTDGISTASLTIYQRAASAPAAPTGGSFVFDTLTLTPPAGWDGGIPAGSDPVYASHGLANIQGTSGTDSSIPWSSPELVMQNSGSGSDGQSVYQARIFRRSASAPSTPANDSATYDFTANTLTPPSGWFESPPAGNDPLYVSDATFSITGPTGVDSTQTWTTPVIFAEDGNDGADGAAGTDGQSTYQFNVYQRSGGTPGTPTGGSFNFGTNVATAPSGWSTGIPGGNDPLWVSTTLASISGDTGIDNSLSWSTPVIMAQDGAQGPAGNDGSNGSNGVDGTDGDSTATLTIYARSASPIVSAPTGGSFNFDTLTLTTPAGWFNYIPNGDDPVYSSHGLANINGTTGTDNSINWGSPEKVMENGIDGNDGANGGDGLSTYLARVYQRDVNQPSTPSLNSASYNFGTNTLTPPSGWSTDIPSGFEPLWVTEAIFTVQGATGIDNTQTWSTPQLIGQSGDAVGAALNQGRNTSRLDYWFANNSQTSSLPTSVWSINSISDNIKPYVIRGEDNNNNSNDIFSERIPIVPGQKYRVSVDAIQRSGTRPHYLLVAFYDSNGTNISSSTTNATGWTSIGTYHYWEVANSAFSSSWTTYSREFGGDASTTIPTNATHMAIGGLFLRTGTGNTIIEIQDYFVVEASQAGASAFTLLNSANTEITPTTVTGLSDTDWVSGAYTLESYSTPSFASARMVEVDRLMFGLSNDNGGSATYTTIDYAIYLTGGDILVYESGVNRGTFTTATSSDVLAVINFGDRVEYQKNGVTFYTSSVTPSGAYRFDCSFAGIGDKLLDISFGPFGESGADGADGADGSDGTNGSDGNDGQSTYQFNVYRRASSTPSTPSGGSFNFGTNTATPPSGWSTSAPAANGNPLYISTTLASIAGDTGTDSSLSWSTPVIMAQDGADGSDGSDGSNGSDGERGSKSFYRNYTSWSNSQADAAITSAGYTKVNFDVVTLYDAASGFSETRYWNGSSWIVVSQVIDGNLIVHGTVGTNQLEANSITANKLSIITSGSEPGNNSNIAMTLDPLSSSPFTITSAGGDNVFSINLEEGEPKASVNGVAGTGFINDLSALTEEVKKGLNPDYLGIGDFDTYTHPNAPNNTTDTQTVTATASGKINVSFKMNRSSFIESGSSSNYTTPVWTLVVRRNNSSGTLLFNKQYTGVAYNSYDGESGTWMSSYNINIDSGFVDEGATPNANNTYWFQLTRQSGTPTLMTIDEWRVEAPSFVERDNTYDGNSSGGYSWTDSSTGVTMKWGSLLVSGNNSASVTFSESFTFAHSGQATNRSTGTGSDTSSNMTSLTSTGCTVNNAVGSTQTVYWFAIGYKAL